MQAIKKQPLKASVLNLAYAFVSNPNPIIVSTEGETPKLVSLIVIISNPHTYPISVDKIEIKIPVGEDSARDLSTDPTLPTPVYDTNKSWMIMVNAGTVTINSNDGQPLEITDQSISFKLNAIAVNDIVGIVPITITEYVTDAAKVSDANAYTLMKLAADYPVTNFYAKPEIFYRNGQSTVLYWDCSEYGQDCVYKVHSDSWRPNIFYSADDGQAGVQSPPLYQTTTFALDIYKSDSEGNRNFIDTLYTTVPVVVPAFYDTKCDTNVGGIQRLVRLYWTAVNASRCEIQVNGKTYISDVPADTNPNGYLLLIGENDPNSDVVLANIAVVAYSEDSIAIASYQVPSILMKSFTQHTMSYATPPLVSVTLSLTDSIENTYGIGVTPDGTQAFVVGLNITYSNSDSNGNVLIRGTPYLNRITLANFACQPIVLDGEDNYIRATNTVATNDVAYTSLNIGYAYGHNPGGDVNYLKKITLNNNQVDSFNGLLGDVGLSLTANNQYVLIARSPNQSIFQGQPSGIVNVNTSNLQNPVQLNLDQAGCCHTAITPSQQLVLVTNKGSSTISVIDITQLAQGVMTLSNTLTVGNAPVMTAISSDGTFALVANSGSSELSVINLSNMTVEANTIKVGSNPYSIAITRDNQYAYVANKGNGTVTLVDIKNRCSIPGAITIGSNPVAVAMTGNGRILVIQENSNVLTNIWA